MSQWNLDIISAFYGPLDVTDAARTVYVERAFTDPKLTTFTITPTNALFKIDPLPNFRKSFVVVYRVKLSVDLDYGRDGQYSFTDLRRAVSEEGQELRINFEPTDTTSAFKPPTTYARNVPFIVNASYYTKDVTDIVRQFFDKNSSLTVTNQNLGGDPIVNTKKSLVITWAYAVENGGLVFQAQGALEGTSITGPFQHGRQLPRLTIRAANYAGISVTDRIQALVDANQAVAIDMNRPLQTCGMTSDLWPNVPKTLNILYQWEGRSLELLTAADGSGTHRLDPAVPVDPLRKGSFNPEHGRTAGKVNIIALVWGINQGITSIPGDKFQQIAAQRKFTPSNTWFGFDGWPNVPKMGDVFYQYGISGPIRSASAKEGAELVLPEPYGVLDPLPAKGLLNISDQSGLFGFRLKSPHTNTFVRVINNGLSALARGPEDAAIFAIKTPDDLSSRLAIYDTDQTFIGWVGAEANSALQVKKEAKEAIQVNYEFPGKWGGKLCLLSFYRGIAQAPEVFVATEPLTRSQLMAISVDSAYGVFGAGYEVEFVFCQFPAGVYSEFLWLRIWLNLGAEPGFLQRLAGSYAAILNAKTPQDLGLGVSGTSIASELKGTSSALAARPPVKVELRAVKDEFDDEL
ncbi:hypothetical protein BDN72DRAFT_865912 [Pluteus cervinus]|uniref:Uncharacterized protein n=1 Tax=Pluteus cervinus TaxID=181527 RepID=A0ACD2ZZE9_9AGAR|nr:hypothetical protein BDN72DRAFT_865912 [Pluteus cervinus]